jgi:hypothetical protein
MISAAQRMADRRREGWALIYRSEYELWAHAFDPCEKTLRSAEAIGEEGGFDDVRWLAQLFLLSLFIIVGRLDEARDLAPLLRTFPEDIGSSYARLVGAMMSMPLHGEVDSAEAVDSWGGMSTRRYHGRYRN